MSRRDLILIALIVSAVVHVAVMIWARPKVMTTVVRGLARVHRHVNTVSREEPPADDLTEMSLVEDEEARKDAPETDDEELLKLSALSSLENLTLDDNAQLAAPEPSEISREIENYKIIEAPGVFDTPPIVYSAGTGRNVELQIKFEPPPPALAAAGEPEIETVMESEPIEVPAGTMPELDVVDSAPEAEKEDPARLVKERPPEFVPQSVVTQEVNIEQVESAKTAVREMIDDYEAADIHEAVSFACERETRDGYTYFRVRVTPKPDLPIVSKDIVVLIDTSPSVGRDRLASIKEAIKQLLVTGTNTGDRFNIVAFSDKFQYAFNSWQACDTYSFNYAEKWIDERVLHGWTDVFGVIRSVLTLPRDPKRPLIALVVTDGDANAGVSETAQILAQFSALNDGLVSVYMYGVKGTANKELIDVLTRGNRGEGMIYKEGVFRNKREHAGSQIDNFANRFKMPVLTDLRVVFASGTDAEAYPALLRNLYRGTDVDIIGRVKGEPDEIAFSLKGLAGEKAYEGFVKIPLAGAPVAKGVYDAFGEEAEIERKTRK